MPLQLVSRTSELEIPTEYDQAPNATRPHVPFFTPCHSAALNTRQTDYENAYQRQPSEGRGETPSPSSCFNHAIWPSQPETSRVTQIFSPPVSPKSWPPGSTIPRLQDPEQWPEYTNLTFDPQPTPSSPKPHKGSKYRRPSVEDADEEASLETMSISTETEEGPSLPTPHQTFPHTHPATYSSIQPTPQTITSPTSNAQYHPNMLETLNRQRELFEGLERTCTAAACRYYHEQYDSALDRPLVIRTSRAQRLRCNNLPFRPHPYHISTTTTNRFLPSRPPPHHPPFHIHSYHQLLTLPDYLVRIAQHLCDRAIASGNHAEDREAVHRMWNLYAWGAKVVKAARGGDDAGRAYVDQQGVLEVVVAARDLAAWLLMRMRRWRLRSFGSIGISVGGKEGLVGGCWCREEKGGGLDGEVRFYGTSVGFYVLCVFVMGPT